MYIRFTCTTGEFSYRFTILNELNELKSSAKNELNELKSSAKNH